MGQEVGMPDFSQATVLDRAQSGHDICATRLVEQDEMSVAARRAVSVLTMNPPNLVMPQCALTPELSRRCEAAVGLNELLGAGSGKSISCSKLDDRRREWIEAESGIACRAKS